MNSNCEAPTQQQNLPFRSEIESNIQPYLNADNSHPITQNPARRSAPPPPSDPQLLIQ